MCHGTCAKWWGDCSELIPSFHCGLWQADVFPVKQYHRLLFLSLFLLHLYYLSCVHVFGGAKGLNISWWAYGDQRTTCENWILTSTLCVPGIINPGPSYCRKSTTDDHSDTAYSQSKVFIPAVWYSTQGPKYNAKHPEREVGVEGRNHIPASHPAAESGVEMVFTQPSNLVEAKISGYLRQGVVLHKQQISRS